MSALVAADVARRPGAGVEAHGDADASLERELAGFAAAEAALLDAGRYDEWLALFAEDAHYWVPLAGASQADPFTHQSLAYEDRLLLALRVERLKNPRAHSQQPRSTCQHVLQPSTLDLDGAAGDAETVRLRTPFLYIEARGGTQLMLAGTCRHRLARGGDGAWKIREKRVDLLDAGRPLPMVQLFI